jgi:alpha-1,3-mannosyltransferase
LNSLFSDPELPLPQHETIDGMEIVRIPWKGSSRYPFAPSVLKHLADADLIHVHAVDFFFDALAFASPFHRKPMVATTHGGFFHTNQHSRIKKLWFQVTTRLSCRAYQSVIACSTADKRLFDRVNRGQTLLIENGADTLKFDNAASKMPVRRAITIGRFSSNKKIGNLIKTMQALVQRSHPWHLDIVGVPSDFSENDIRTEIAAAGLENHIGLHIGLSNAAISSLIGEASFFVSASDYEGFGLVAIEAMSAGLVPVLQPNVAYQDLAQKHAIIELADFSKSGEAAGKLEAAFENLAKDKGTRREVARKAASLYNWDSVAENYVQAYHTAGLTLPSKAFTT